MEVPEFCWKLARLEWVAVGGERITIGMESRDFAPETCLAAAAAAAACCARPTGGGGWLAGGSGVWRSEFGA